MFFQPKFYRGCKATPPSTRSRAGSVPVSDDSHGRDMHSSSLSSSSGRRYAEDASNRGRQDEVTQRWDEGEYSMTRAGAGAARRIEYFEPLHKSPTTPQRPSRASRPPLTTSHFPPSSLASALPTISPISPFSPLCNAIPPLDNPLQQPSTPNNPAGKHSTTPSLSSGSDTSDRSFQSDSLLTPNRAYLHPPASPALSVAPHRPLPPVPSDSPASSPPQPRRPSATSSIRLRAGVKVTPPPAIGLYASMPLPPLPSAAGDHPRSGAPALQLSGPVTPSTNPLRPDRPARSCINRDSQATVRPRDVQSRLGHRDLSARDARRILPLPPIIVESPTDLFSFPFEPDVYIFGEADLEAELADLGILDIFPMPPSRTYAPPSPSTISPPTVRPMRKKVQLELDTDTSTRWSKRLSSSKSTIKPRRRKAPPPPLPQLDFDLFSVEHKVEEKAVRVEVSEADRIREQYLRARSRI